MTNSKPQSKSKALNADEFDIFKGFSKLTRTERFQRLVDMGALTASDTRYLENGGLKDLVLAEKFIENVIGYFQMPLGVAANFCIDGREMAIPMAVEETSIIAAASKTAKWIREQGAITTKVIGSQIIGQIQIAKVKDFGSFKEIMEANRSQLIKMANTEVAQGLVARGGGVQDIQVRKIARDDQDVNAGFMAVVHVLADPCDAMGANVMNQVCELLKIPIQELTGESVTMCILSNLVDTRLTQACVRMSGLSQDMVDRIVEASLFAKQDPYRAATNNKGVLNGIDPVLIATGNDWRAVEAGVHAYAARDGRYRSITTWQKDANGDLCGELIAPIVVGTVGGVTKLHPTAQLGLRMLGVRTAAELSRICAAVGLVQNLGALRALTTEGIIEGHMKLHIKNLALGAGALEKEAPFVQKRLEEILLLRKRISLSNAVDVLRELRAQGAAE